MVWAMRGVAWFVSILLVFGLVPHGGALDELPKRTRWMSPEECMVSCDPSLMCVRVGYGRARCVSRCLSDADCPSGMVCQCRDPTRCARGYPETAEWRNFTCEHLLTERWHWTRQRVYWGDGSRGFSTRELVQAVAERRGPCLHGMHETLGVCLYSCESTAECPVGMVCVDKLCAIGCRMSQCPPGFECYGRVGIDVLDHNVDKPPYCRRIFRQPQ